MRKIEAAVTISLLILASLVMIQKVEAAPGEAKVFILNLTGVPSSWVDNKSRVAEGAIDACVLKGQHIENNVPLDHPKRNVDYPPYYDATPCVVTEWDLYKSIVTSCQGTIVVNAHGEYLPVPSGYNRESWADKIAQAMLNQRLTWVHVGGYTFNCTYYQNGTSGLWGDQGFKHLMANINKNDTNLSPYPYSEDEIVTNALVGQTTQIGLNWCDGNGRSLLDYTEANMGRPLKVNDFKECLLLPIFEGGDRWTAAAIAFAKAGARYTADAGCGAYVHIGARYLYGSGWAPDSDYGRGFIGTAAALWYETMQFEHKQASGSWEDGLHQAFFQVHPSIAGVWKDGSIRKLRLIFSVWGMTKFPVNDGTVRFEKGIFRIDGLPYPWNNTDMMVNMDYSREEGSEALQFTGLYNESNELYGLLPEGILWAISTPLVKTNPIAGGIFWTMEGFMLFGEWLGHTYSGGYPHDGVNQWNPWIEFHWNPLNTLYKNETTQEFSNQFCSLVAVELRIPSSDPSGNPRAGWLTMPLTYHITLQTSYYHDLEINGTLQIAAWFSLAGQNDAGSGGDAGNNETSRTPIVLPGNYHGYIAPFNEVDDADWYGFNVTSVPPATSLISVNVTPPPYVNFDVEVYSPSGIKYESHNGPGSPEILCCDGEVGLWKTRIYRVSRSGVYSLQLSWQAGGGDPGTCPTLFVWDGSDYVYYGVINIHNPCGEDVTREVPVLAEDVGIANYTARFRLREGWAGLNFSESVIDQVKLFAVVDGNRLACPLVKATHSRLGNVLFRLLLSDDRKVQTLLLETIDLTFLMPYPTSQIQSYVFTIEGCNMFKV